MRESIVESRPDVVREIYRVLKESRAAAALPTGADDPLRFGIEAIRGSLDEIATRAFRQRLIPRCPSVDKREQTCAGRPVVGESRRALQSRSWESPARRATRDSQNWHFPDETDIGRRSRVFVLAGKREVPGRPDCCF
jgi:hypothetical protein